MPAYHYKAVTATGQSFQGTYKAHDRNDVLAMLRQRQSYPILIEESSSKDIRSFRLQHGVKVKDIAVFCRQFHAMLNAGISMIKCLEILRGQVENRKLKLAVTEMYEDVQKGALFSDVLKKHEIFPELLVHMVEAGEASGTLDVIMDRMAVHYEKEFKIKNKVQTALMYPIVLGVIATISVIFLLTVVMPTFISLFEGSKIELPLPTRILLLFSDGLRKFWHVFVLGAMILFYFGKRWGSTPEGRMHLDRLQLRLPIIKGFIQKIATARFSRTLSTLLSSGIPLIQSLENAAGVVGNLVIAEGIQQVKEEVRKGVSLADSIQRAGFFPPMVDGMVGIGEESGTLDDILEKTANFYDEEVETSLQKLVGLLEPVMIVVMAVIVGVIVIAIVLPIFEMTNAID